jgi:hypothetical protein
MVIDPRLPVTVNRALSIRVQNDSMEVNRTNGKQNDLVKKIARLDSNTKLPGRFTRKAVFPLGAVVHQHLPEGYGVGLKIEQGNMYFIIIDLNH